MQTQLNEFELKIATVLNELTSSVSSPADWLSDALSSGNTSSGANVGVGSALGLPSVWNSIFRIAGHIGMLPVEVRRPIGGTMGTSEMMPNHPACIVLNRANERQTGQVFRETMMANALLEGNGRAYISRNNLGQPTDLLLIPPSYVYSMMWEGEKWHIVNLPNHYANEPIGSYSEANGGPPNGWYRIPDADILHIPGLSYEGLWGISLLHNSRDVIGLDKSGQDATGYSFRNNGRLGLLLEAPRNAFTTAKSTKEFLDQFNEMHQGLDNKGKTGLIREGMKAHILPTSSVDAQHLENRRFSREDIALLFGTESVMGEGSAVYKDRQDRMLAYLQNCLARWFQRWNMEAQRKLFSDRDRAAGVFLKFDVQPLIQGDPNLMADYTGKLITQNIMSVNEARALHNLNPVPGGDEVIMQEPEPEQTETESEGEQEEEENDSPQARTIRAATYRVFADVIKDEVKRVRQISKKPEFLDKLDSVVFFVRGTLLARCEELGLPKELADAHCDESLRMLKDLAATCGDNLPDQVQELTDKWKTRAGDFSNAV